MLRENAVFTHNLLNAEGGDQVLEAITDLAYTVAVFIIAHLGWFICDGLLVMAIRKNCRLVK